MHECAQPSCLSLNLKFFFDKQTVIQTSITNYSPFPSDSEVLLQDRMRNRRQNILVSFNITIVILMKQLGFHLRAPFD
ncbi:hypothetical protein L873DRAFT_920564 [Choiromyces venosus 120613-1]|uniref:Uncharacterized protein n=1 Tax=Choiromyces venosus 120613-1 TaxID=1336337 RepID=A0A3N4JQR0_9PEZI|nr:hypothetical protein L873DRAFT_920564 [Choiromyces venosus 120613-1]